MIEEKTVDNVEVKKEKKPKGVKGLSGKTTKITLFFDGEKYKDPVFVGINGNSWLVQRGVEVEVPVEVAEVLKNSERQDNKTAKLMKELSNGAKELIV